MSLFSYTISNNNKGNVWYYKHCVCRERERERERENKMYAYKNESIKQIFNYLLGHLRALCPACRHAPQSRERFAGGSSLAEVVRRGGDEVGGGGGGVDGVGVGGGRGKLSGGAEGRGHVMSFRRSGHQPLVTTTRPSRWTASPRVTQLSP